MTIWEESLALSPRQVWARCAPLAHCLRSPWVRNSLCFGCAGVPVSWAPERCRAKKCQGRKYLNCGRSLSQQLSVCEAAGMEQSAIAWKMWSRSPKGQRTPPPRKPDFCCCAKQRGGSLHKSSTKENAANWEKKWGLAGPPRSIAFPHSGGRARLEAAGAASPGNPEGHDSAAETHIPAIPFDIFALYLRHVSLPRPRTMPSAPLYPCSMIGLGLGLPSALWDVCHSSASPLVTGWGWGAQGIWWQWCLSELWPFLCLRFAPGVGVKVLYPGETRTRKAERLSCPQAPCCPLIFLCVLLQKGGFPVGSDGRESARSAEDLGLILGWEDPLEKGMSTWSSVLAWRIPWTEESGGLLSMGSQRVGEDWMTFTSLSSKRVLAVRALPSFKALFQSLLSRELLLVRPGAMGTASFRLLLFKARSSYNKATGGWVLNVHSPSEWLGFFSV